MIDKILKKLNIHADVYQKWILTSMVISGLLGTYAHPVLLKAVISELPSQWIAFESMTSSVMGLLIGIAWQKSIRKACINGFLFLTISECVCGFLLGLYLAFVEFNVWVFAIASLIYTTFISGFVGKCIMAFKARLWNDEKREAYDNNTGIVAGIVCMIGYAFALVTPPSLTFSLTLWALCCVFDDIGWIVVYMKNKKKLKEC